MSKKSLLEKPVFWVAIVIVGVAGYALTGEQSGPHKTTTKKPTKKSTAKGSETYTKEDELASYQRVNTSVKNTFLPLVAKSSGLGSGGDQANYIPASFTGGGGQWVFTGTVEVDGVRQALLEDRAADTGTFLTAGQRWKNCVVKKVSEDSLVLDGPSGLMTFGLVNDEKLSRGRMAVNTGNSSYSPATIQNGGSLRGQIGNSRLPGVNGGGFNAVPQSGGPVIMSSEAPAAVPLGGE